MRWPISPKSRDVERKFIRGSARPESPGSVLTVPLWVQAAFPRWMAAWVTGISNVEGFEKKELREACDVDREDSHGLRGKLHAFRAGPY